LYLREIFASTKNKCHINSNDQSRLTEVNTTSAIRETPRIFWNPKVYWPVRSIPPLCLSSFFRPEDKQKPTKTQKLFCGT
jgi:hypothetical protein